MQVLIGPYQYGNEIIPEAVRTISDTRPTESGTEMDILVFPSVEAVIDSEDLHIGVECPIAGVASDNYSVLFNALCAEYPEKYSGIIQEINEPVSPAPEKVLPL